jgi:DNA primase
MTIPEIKQRLSMPTVLGHYGLQPNRNEMLACPFHEDKKPSMRVYPETNTVYCFAGSCKVSNLDVIDFIMQMDGSSKHVAILKAKALIGEQPVTLPVPEVVKESTPAQDFIAQYQEYRAALQRSKTAQAYCTGRGLKWDRYEMGYKSTSAKASADKWGRGCLLFPLRNEAGKISGFYGRAIKGNGHYYQRNRSGLYPRYPLADTRTLILTESIIDAQVLRQEELPLEVYTILALYGTNGLTDEHRAAIRQLPQLEEIILALDGDEAGHQATEEVSKTLYSDLPGIKISTLVLPEGEDINSLAVKEEDNGRLFRGLVRNRVRVGKNDPVSPPPTTLATDNPNNLVYITDLATYYIKGGLRCGSRDLDSLKVTLVTQHDGRKSRQKLDLYEDKQVEKAARAVGERLGLRPDLVEIDLSTLTDLLEQYREQLQDEEQEGSAKIKVPSDQRSKCLDFLQAPDLVKRLNELIGKAGVAGEEVNRLLLFVVASSFGMTTTLHALIQGASGSGKTRLLRIISELIPEEVVKRYTRVTDGSFYNQAEYYFKNKLLCFEDIDGLKEEALLAVRELQSNEVLITSTSLKDEQGNIRGGERIVRGPIASISCTTRAEVYEDNISRCFVVAVDESKEQSLRIIQYQNDKAAGVIETGREKKVRSFLQNCIRLLQPLEVINPYANRIHLPPDAHKIRRLNELYQSFVRQLTLLHQYQRKTDERGRLITDPEDLRQACDILFESIVLKVDELDGSLRQFFERLKEYVGDKGKEYEFTQREIRLTLRISKSQMQRYMNALINLEYLQQLGFANRGYRYKICYWDDNQALRQRIKRDLQEQINRLG